MQRVLAWSMVGVLLLSPLGCASKKGTGAIVGGTVGAGVGAIIGDATGNTAVGAIIGAAVGGAAGAYIGNYMDKQAEEIRQDLDGATVTRVGEGIKITFDSGILFDVNRATLKDPARANLQELAQVLNKYPDTNILVEGHTDSDGAEDHNLDLSKRRAASVTAFLAAMNVDPTRVTEVGYGELQPVASNETVEGKAANRRVELAIMANDKLKKEAERKAG